jgi:hypothetical protein
MVKTTPIWCILLVFGLSSASFPSELQQYATADWPTIGTIGKSGGINYVRRLGDNRNILTIDGDNTV